MSGIGPAVSDDADAFASLDALVNVLGADEDTRMWDYLRHAGIGEL